MTNQIDFFPERPKFIDTKKYIRFSWSLMLSRPTRSMLMVATSFIVPLLIFFLIISLFSELKSVSESPVWLGLIGSFQSIAMMISSLIPFWGLIMIHHLRSMDDSGKSTPGIDQDISAYLLVFRRLLRGRSAFLIFLVIFIVSGVSGSSSYLFVNYDQMHNELNKIGVSYIYIIFVDAIANAFSMGFGMVLFPTILMYFFYTVRCPNIDFGTIEDCRISTFDRRHFVWFLPLLSLFFLSSSLGKVLMLSGSFWTLAGVALIYGIPLLVAMFFYGFCVSMIEGRSLEIENRSNEQVEVGRPNPA